MFYALCLVLQMERILPEHPNGSKQKRNHSGNTFQCLCHKFHGKLHRAGASRGPESHQTHTVTLVRASAERPNRGHRDTKHGVEKPTDKGRVMGRNYLDTWKIRPPVDNFIAFSITTATGRRNIAAKTWQKHNKSHHRSSAQH